jgi:hypothetical protein
VYLRPKSYSQRELNNPDGVGGGEILLMSRISSRSGAEIALTVLFGGLAAVGFLCSFFAMVLTLAEPGQGHYKLVPLFFGLVLAGGGSIAMVLGRRRFSLNWTLLLAATVLWSAGAIIFAFGLTAAMLYDEPNEFASNLGYSVGLCMAPGLFLALIGLFVFWVEARKGRKGDAGETAVSPDEGADEWLESIKAEEKSKLDEDTF